MSAPPAADMVSASLPSTTGNSPVGTRAGSAGVPLLPRRPAKRRGRVMRWIAALAAIGLTGAMTIWAVPEWHAFVFPAARGSQDFLTERVTVGPFLLTVVEKGTIDSSRNAILASKVEGSTTIISIVPEGTEVKEGDLLVELDSSLLVDKETSQRIAVTQAESALEQAKENLAIQITQNESDIAAASLKLRLAELDLDKFRDGEFKQQVSELKGQVKIAEEALSRTKESQQFVARMAKKGYRNQNDVEAERLAVNKAEIDLKVAQGKLEVTETYNYTRTLEELEANATEYARARERVERRANTAVDQKKADLQSRELTAEVEQNKLKRLQTQITNCKIFAPQDGQVVYANTRGAADQTVLIEEGASVRERQAIINLPDYDSMKVNARIHESRISTVKPGLPVKIKVDAYPDQVFSGEVDSVSSVPISTSFGRSDVKEYEAIIKLVDEGEKVNKLRTGLSASIEIIVEDRQQVLQAPIQSVVTVGRKAFAFVATDDGPVSREVKVGLINEKAVEILEGLVADERVVMHPKTSFAKELAELEIKFGKSGRGRGGEGGRPSGGPPGMNGGSGGGPVGGPGGKPGGGRPSGPPGEFAGERKNRDGGTDRPDGAPVTGGNQPDGSRRREEGEPGRRNRGSDGAADEKSASAPAGGWSPLNLLKEQDKNGDGKLSRDEVSDRLLDGFDRIDKDADGLISSEELQSMTRGRPAS